MAQVCYIMATALVPPCTGTLAERIGELLVMFSRVASVLLLTAVTAACSSHGNQGDPAKPSETDAGERDAAQDASQPDAGDGNVAGQPAPAGSAGTGGSAPQAGSGGSAGHAAVSGGSGGASAPAVSYQELEADATVIASTTLAKPSDLSFNPYVQDELWVMNHEDSSTTIIQNASKDSRSVLRRIDPEAARHFSPSPTGIDFGGKETTIVDAAGKPVIGTFATCPESSESFMGPTLWTSDLRIFAITKTAREPPFNSDATGAEGEGSHIDMLHRTPACTGIAWEGAGNKYWTYSGTNAMFVRYDFNKDHGIGNDDHTDGSEWRYAVSGIRYVQGIPSHLAWDSAGKRLYMADSGNARVVSFDPESVTGTLAMSSGDNVDALQTAMDMSGGQVKDFVPASYGMKLPSGVELHQQRLYISDNETGIIHRFALDGTPLGKLTIHGLGSRSLAGITFGPDGKLYFVDMGGSRVLRSEVAF
jgi:hypothetical protein